MLLVFLLSLLCVLAQAKKKKGGNRPRNPRFPHTRGRPGGRTGFAGVYTELEPSSEDPDADEGAIDVEDAEDVKKGAAAMGYVTVTPDGETTEYEVDADDLGIILRVGELFGEEKSEGATDDEGDEEASEDRRRLKVFPPDTRYEITSATWMPTKQSGYLSFQSAAGYHRCSGCLIGPRHVLTAGHCVHQGNGGDWYGNFVFYAGRTSYTSGVAFGWSGVTTYASWANSGNYDYDLALIKLNANTNLGWVSFGYHSGIDSSWWFYSKGYPADKNGQGQGPYSSWGQWSTSGRIGSTTTNLLRTYTTDTYGGHSGAPFYSYEVGMVIYAPHSGWGTLWTGQQFNRHTRITSSKFSNLCDWIDDASVC